MKKNSIFVNISLIFFISFISLLILFFILFRLNENIFIHSLEKHYEPIVKMIIYSTRNRIPSQILFDNLNRMNLNIVKEQNQKEAIINKENVVYFRQIANKTFITTYKHKDKFYVQVITYKFNILLESDEKESKTAIYLLLAFFVVLLINFFTYTAIIKKLLPLKTLRNEIKKFGEGNLEIDCKTDKDDEISIVANEFDNAVSKIKTLKEARNIFIRNIMHELKTPITKGKLLLALVDDKTHKCKLNQVFIRLESLINEFASIEKVMVNKDLERKNYLLIDILDNAIDLLMLDSLEIEHNLKCEKVNINYKLYSIAIKNILDNAVKYSKDSRLKIELNSNKIEFKTFGEKLKKDFDSYLEPFSKGEDSNSFGLGLYIINHILKAHEQNLNYRYENGYNIFIFEDVEILKK